MPSINTITLMGHLGSDAETKYTPNGTAVTTMNLATTRSWKPENATEWKEETTWHRVKAWRVHEKTLEYLKKGNLVCVTGRQENRQYEDKNGEKRWASEVVADRVMFLREPFRGGPKDAEAPAGHEMPPPDDSDVPF